MTKPVDTTIGKEKQFVKMKTSYHAPKKSQAREEFEALLRPTEFKTNWQRTREITSKYTGPFSPSRNLNLFKKEKSVEDILQKQQNAMFFIKPRALSPKMNTLKVAESLVAIRKPTLAFRSNRSLDKTYHQLKPVNNSFVNLRQSRDLLIVKPRDAAVSSIQKLESLSGVHNLNISRKESLRDFSRPASRTTAEPVRRVKSQTKANLFDKCFINLTLNNRDLDADGESGYRVSRKDRESSKMNSDPRDTPTSLFWKAPMVNNAKSIEEVRKPQTDKIEKFKKDYDENLKLLRSVVTELYTRNSNIQFWKIGKKDIVLENKKADDNIMEVSFEKKPEVGTYYQNKLDSLRANSKSYNHIFDASIKQKNSPKGDIKASTNFSMKKSLSIVKECDPEKSGLRKALCEFRKIQSDSSTNLPTNDSEYTLSSILGQGRFGIVRLAYQSGNKNKPCVIKLYNKVKLIQANALQTVEVVSY